MVSVKDLTADQPFKECYELRIRQPLDHQVPDGATFQQRVYLSHMDESQPVVLVTEGYAAGGRRMTELSGFLQANQIIVEHRFFGESKPDTLDWNYLTVRQSAEDLHAITTIFKALYKGAWVSTGISKGGQTTLYYRYYYPADVTMSVPYVAPINVSREDPRIFTWLRTVGDPECRKRIREFQQSMLHDEDTMLSLLEEHAKQKMMKFSMGIATAYEYAVLEYSFSFWQWARAQCGEIPRPTASAQDRFTHLLRVVSLNDYDDAGVAAFEPFFYQAYTEIGYYGYDITEFKGLLKAVRVPTNSILAPKNAPLTFDCTTLQTILPWLQTQGANIIYIYGGNDPWTASAVEPYGTTNALKIVKPGGSHTTRISNLPPDQRERVLSTMEQWLGIRSPVHGENAGYLFLFQS